MIEIISALGDGVWQALQPVNLGLAFIGVVVGLFVGAMPGLGSVNGVAILLPFTFVIQKYTGTATSPMIFHFISRNCPAGRRLRPCRSKGSLLRGRSTAK
jgi:hypothetical protein